MCLWTAVPIIERTTHIGPATGGHALSRHHAATPGARGTSRVDQKRAGIPPFLAFDAQATDAYSS